MGMWTEWILSVVKNLFDVSLPRSAAESGTEIIEQNSCIEGEIAPASILS